MTTIAGPKAIHIAVGVIPATLTVIFAGLIALIALILDSSRRKYALDLADRFVDLASVLVGGTPPALRGAPTSGLSESSAQEPTDRSRGQRILDGASSDCTSPVQALQR